jgi:hypothetical protein
MNYTIEPGEGLDILLFGMDTREIIDMLGAPAEKDTAVSYTHLTLPTN